MDLKTCSDFNEEQLYMFEFLIDHIDLNAETIEQIANSTLSVSLKFIDFPAFEISQEEFVHAKNKAQDPKKLKSEKLQPGSVDFSMGKSCLFPKKPNDLVQAMRSQPLQVGIFTATQKNEYEPEKEKPPVCETKVLLSGCLCDQVAMFMNDENRLPKPYVIKNTYNLIDNQGDPSGTISLFLRLTCFGKSIVTQFALQDRSFLFKSSQSPNEFQCTKISTESEMDQGGICDSLTDQKEEVGSLKPQNMIGLTSICQELSKRDGGPPDLFPLLPEVVSRQEIQELFRKEQNIDEEDPLCICPDDGNYLKTLSRIQSCGGVGCAGGLCVGTRLLDPLPRDHHGASTKSPCYTGSCCTGGVQNCCKLFRMRGGGCCKDSGPDSSRFGKQSRGIIDDPIFRNFSPEKDLPSNQTMETLVSGACKSAWKDTAMPGRTGCGCFGKRGAGLDKAGGTCSKKPCMGIDCLIRSFKEIQEFVDSIGKVPGLAGLGLMDPSESPYFGREEETGNTCGPKSRKGFQNPTRLFDAPNTNALHHKNSQAKEKKVTEMKTKLETSTPSPYAATQTVYSVFSTHTFRESPNSHTENLSHILAKPKRKEDKSEKVVHESQRPKQEIPQIETGPCGESKCKSKRKRGKEDMEDSVSTSKPFDLKKHSSNAAVNSSKVSSNIKVENKEKKQNRGRVLSKHAGPSVNRGPSNSSVKVSKNVLKHIYLLGKLNSGVVFGHKNCLDLRMRVPKNMGWLWNTREVLGMTPPKFGWKPGAISRYVYELLQKAKASSGPLLDSRSSTPMKGKKGKSTRVKSSQSFGRHPRSNEKKNPEVELPPTLHIHRKNGTYYITMFPIKQESADNPEVQEHVKPLQFKVTKNKDDASVCSSSTASDMEIEFSPPAAINRYHKKAEVKNIDIQVKQQDILDAFKSSSTKPEKSKKEKAKK